MIGTMRSRASLPPIHRDSSSDAQCHAVVWCGDAILRQVNVTNRSLLAVAVVWCGDAIPRQVNVKNRSLLAVAIGVVVFMKSSRSCWGHVFTDVCCDDSCLCNPCGGAAGDSALPSSNIFTELFAAVSGLVEAVCLQGLSFWRGKVVRGLPP